LRSYSMAHKQPPSLSVGLTPTGALHLDPVAPRTGSVWRVCFLRIDAPEAYVICGRKERSTIRKGSEYASPLLPNLTTSLSSRSLRSDSGSERRSLPFK